MPGQELELVGDEDVYAGDVPSAKHRYGAAINAYLRERNYEAAIRTCRKLIRLAPDVVRTHYTLAYLLVGRGRYEQARDALESYMDAVRDGNMQSQAVPFLTLLAYVVDDPDTRATIVGMLDQVRSRGERSGAETYEAILREPLAGSATSQQRWERLLPIALQIV